MAILVWFKRDLRVHDHPALARAAALSRETGEAVLPLYVFEPEFWRLPDASARQFAFVCECLADLRGALAARGAPLVVRVGDVVALLRELVRAQGVTRVVSHEETGNLWTYARDRRVAAFLREQGIVWEELPQGGVVRRLKGRDGWAARRDAFVARPQVEAPASLRGVPGLDPGAIPDAASLGLAPDPCPRRQRGGREAALRLLHGFLTRRGEHYRAAMATPIAGERACSRLSPHLAFGSLSIREAAQAGAARAAERPGGRWPGALASFESRLAWRDHFMQKLEDEPRIETHCLHRAAEALRPRESDPARLSAWTSGETGLPFVDACMRYLQATGWLNFRMRSMLVAVASYHLWLDWRATGPVLARAFTDYEPGIHWPQVQMQSGVTGINTPRIYNPVKQGRDQDPTGEFTRRWCPELRDVPDAFLQEPWLWPGAQGLLGRAYPAPIVDVAASARAAREAIFGLRRRADGAEIAGIVERHASRADRRFVNDRAPRARRRRAAASDQLDLDF